MTIQEIKHQVAELMLNFSVRHSIIPNQLIEAETQETLTKLVSQS